MKIGILTFHSVTNYGAALQCYGLQKICKSLAKDAEVEVINYQPKSATYYYLKRHLLRNLEFTYPLKLWKFRKFVERYISLSGEPITDRADLVKIAAKYDVIIVGSDEVWKIGVIRGWDPSYFLDFADPTKTRLASYAASSSSTTSYGQHTKEIVDFLQRFSAISVRDTYTRQNIENLVAHEVVEVLDPTLISDFDSITNKSRVYKNKYILVYAKLKKKTMRHLKSWADMQGFDVVSIGHKNDSSNKCFMYCDPAEWLNLIQNAELVVSNYYHGILLSIKYRVPLIPLFSKGKMAKISDIASKLNFTDSICKDFGENNESDLSRLCINYSNVDDLLAGHQKASIAYLKKVLLNDE